MLLMIHKPIEPGRFGNFRNRWRFVLRDGFRWFAGRFLLPALVKKIVRRKSIVGWQSDAADIAGDEALRLPKWRGNNLRKKKMSPDEWQSFAARTAFNEINRQTRTNYQSKTPLGRGFRNCRGWSPLKDNPKRELPGLTRIVWQKIFRWLWWQALCIAASQPAGFD